MKISRYIRAEHMNPSYVEENGGELKATIMGASEQHLWHGGQTCVVLRR